MSERTRVAILGGGIAALATALELTDEDDWASRYEVTIYQMGWRLGGKAASSRRTDEGGRVEEHGLHVWFGCYDESFRLLRRCYEEREATADTRFPTVDDAFTPQDETPYLEHHDGTWSVWPMWFPPNPQRPGTGGPSPSRWDYVVETLEAVVRAAASLLPHRREAPRRSVADAHRAADHPDRAPAGTAAPRRSEAGGPLPWALAHGSHLALRGAHRLARWMPRDPDDHRRVHHRSLLWLLERGRAWMVGALARVATGTAARRALIELDLASTVALGCLRDGVHRHGFDVIDDEDLRAWLARHGARPASVDSTPVRAVYDLYFAYAGGDTATPSFSAGVALGAVFRLGIDYKGSVVWEMKAGMGEVVIAPIYEVLAARGVRFAFFHRVERLELDDDGRGLARVHLARQVDLADGTDTGYRPLVGPISGLRCWPPGPLVDQIRDGERLAGVDLESRWNGWTDAGHRTLEVGEDVDVVVVGISLAGLRDVAADLRSLPRWRDLLDRVGTTQTQAAQLWMDATLDELGWAGGAVPTDADPEPIDVWADRTEVLAVEDWPEPAPRSLQYVCGPMTGDADRRPPEDRGVPAAEHRRAVETLTSWLEERSASVWPAARRADGGFDWDLLHAPPGIDGPDRLARQYVRANIDPSERYVLSLPGTARYRLAPGDSGVEHLVLAGDWTRTDWNVGCIESAVQSGIAAARAVEHLRR